MEKKHVDIQVECVGWNREKCPVGTFTITAGEQKFFATKKGQDGKPLSLPKRCSYCRMQKRKWKEQNGDLPAPTRTAAVASPLSGATSDRELVA